MKVLKQIATLLAFTTIMTTSALSAFAESHACDGNCKDKKECHCEECKCEKGKECACDESCKAENCDEHHKDGSTK